MAKNKKKLSLIAFDADDTLWHNESLYRATREQFCSLLEKYGVPDNFEDEVDRIEIQNLPFYGYGAMSFVLSLIEAGISLTGGRFSTADVMELLQLGKGMLGAGIQLFDHVEETLSQTFVEYPLMLVTKGDLNHQLAKIARSGLKDYFTFVEVVSDKTTAVYQSILERVKVPAEQFLMVGNSLRSDILPVLELGGWAVYIPHDLTWSHEQTELADVTYERLFELAHLGGLPNLLNQIENNRKGNI
jgi:putative hydrolase of the HAD superfamily